LGSSRAEDGFRLPHCKGPVPGSEPGLKCAERTILRRALHNGTLFRRRLNNLNLPETRIPTSPPPNVHIPSSARPTTRATLQKCPQDLRSQHTQRKDPTNFFQCIRLVTTEKAIQLGRLWRLLLRLSCSPLLLTMLGRLRCPVLLFETGVCGFTRRCFSCLDEPLLCTLMACYIRHVGTVKEHAESVTCGVWRL
jgi:hypothetical protein